MSEDSSSSSKGSIPNNNNNGLNGTKNLDGCNDSSSSSSSNNKMRSNGQVGDESGDFRSTTDSGGNSSCGLSNGLATGSTNGCTSGTNGSSAVNGTGKSSVPTTAAAMSDEDSDDDYCVYTYKGDLREQQRLADLPSSFFQFDASESQADDGHSSELSGCLNSCNNGLPSRPGCCSNGAVPGISLHPANGRNHRDAAAQQQQQQQQNIFSPDMDFLEMDFDPSVYADPDGIDSADGDDSPSLLGNERVATNGWTGSSFENNRNNSDSSVRLPPPEEASPSTSSSTSKASPSANSVARKLNAVVLGEECSSSSQNVPSTSRVAVTETVVDKTVKNISDECGVLRRSEDPQPSSSSSPYNNLVAVVNPVDSNSNSQSENSMLRLVKSNTLPELNSKPVTALPSSNCSNFRPSERASILFSSGPVFRGSDPEWSYRARINTAEATSEDSVEVELRRVMIWDLAEAKDIAVTQIGTSACGATAVLNVMRALKIDTTPEFVNECVGTRLRAETADLPEYLFSRSVAGATHSDLISGIRRASSDLIVGKCFPVKNMSVSAFSRWIVQWICKGAIPVVTRNLQVGPYSSTHDIPDAWHHQMVFGVCPEGLFLNNPLECVPLTKILPQLQSESALLVRRHDILSRKGPTTDLRQLARHPDPRWNDMNVLGQVANILLEEIPYFCENTAARRVRSSHIKIPAAYTAGVILFMLRESPACNLLLSGGET